MPQDDTALSELRTACVAGDIDQVQQLFSTKRLTADDASRALGRNISSNNIPLLRTLLEHGADLTNVNIRLVRSGEVLRFLAESGYHVKAQGHRILHKFTDDRATLDWLLDQGVDINRTNTRQLDDGFNLAHGEHDYSLKVLNIVSERGNIDLLDHLVSRGAHPSKSLALHSASRCQNESTAMLTHLIDHHKMDINADTAALRQINHQVPGSGTPLCSAIHHQNLAAVKELLNRGANPELGGARGYPPIVLAIGYTLSYASDPGFLPALRPLIDAGVDPTDALRRAVLCGKVEAAKICLEAGGNPMSGLDSTREEKKRRTERAEHEGPMAGQSELDNAAKESARAMVELLEEWVSK